MSSFIVEYAKSGRSACKHCKLELSKGEVRVGVVSNDRGFAMTKWHHFKCLSESRTVKSLDIATAKGFSVLKDSDQLLLKGLFQNQQNEVEVEVTRKRSWSESTSEKLSPSKKLSEALYNKERWEEMLAGFERSHLSSSYKGAVLPSRWKSWNSIIMNEMEDEVCSSKVAAFDFDGCLANTSVKRVGPDAWSLLYKSIPEKLKTCHEEGYKLVVFTNESNIDRWTKTRQKAVDSKIGRLNGFLDLVKLPMQVIISCGKDGTGDPCRKPAPGMWEFFERHLNGDAVIKKSESFYVGDAAGRKGDHSAADLGFAKDVGVPFLVPEDYFEVEKKRN